MLTQSVFAASAPSLGQVAWSIPNPSYGGERTLAAGASAISRLMRAYAVQVETLRRLRESAAA